MYEILARRLSAAEAAQRLRLPEGGPHNLEAGTEAKGGVSAAPASDRLDTDEEYSASHMLGVRPEALQRSQLEEWPFNQVSAHVSLLEVFVWLPSGLCPFMSFTAQFGIQLQNDPRTFLAREVKDSQWLCNLLGGI